MTGDDEDDVDENRDEVSTGDKPEADDQEDDDDENKTEETEDGDLADEATHSFGDIRPDSTDDEDHATDEIESADAVKATKSRLVELKDGRVVRRSERPDDIRFVSLGAPERSRRDGVEIVNGVVPWRPENSKSRTAQHNDMVRKFLGKPKRRKETPVGTIALARQLRATGLSYAKVSKQLAAKGHLTGTGKRYTPSAVCKMLNGGGTGGCWVGGNWM